MNDGEAADNSVTTDAFLGGRLRLRQFRVGHRAGTDAVLLAAAGSLRAGERFLDVGAGVGAVGLALAQRFPAASGVMLESDAETAALALSNLAENGLALQVSVAAADLFAPDLQSDARFIGGFDLVLSNPPYFAAGSVRLPTDQRRASAYVSAPERSHADWISAMLPFIRSNGRLLVIHRPDALADLVAAASSRLGSLRLRLVHARSDSPAIRLLFGGKAGGRSPTVILPPLILHSADNRFSSEARDLHEGEPMTFWDQRKGRPHRPALGDQ